jgi:hypothetical protein
MNWSDFKSSLQKSHPDDMAANEQINISVRLLRNGLETLGRLGHHFHLAGGPSPEHESNGESDPLAGRGETGQAVTSLPVSQTVPLSKPIVKKVRKTAKTTPEKKSV